MRDDETVTSIFRRDGRRGYTIEYRDPSTLRLRQRSFHTKTEAENYGDLMRAKARAVEGLAADVPFKDYAEAWLTATRTAVRHGTDMNYTWAVRKHLIPALPVTVRGITSKMVRDLIVAKRTAGLSKGTVSSLRKALHAILETAVEEGLLTANPAKSRSKSKLMRLTPSPGEQRSKVQAFTEDQARAFLAAAPKAAPRYALMFRTELAAGLRPGEARGLQPGDIEHCEARIRLERAITPQDRIEPCKTSADGGFEYVDIPELLVEELRQWDASQGRAALATGRSKSVWLFPDEDGGFLDRYRCAAAFRRVLKAAGLPLHFTQKALRHSFATLALIAGESVYWVSRQLRHRDISITVKTYGSWLPTGNREAADRVFARLVSDAVSFSKAKGAKRQAL